MRLGNIMMHGFPNVILGNAERDRDIENVQESIRIAGRLGNASFVDRAPAEVVQQARDRHAELLAEIERLRASLSAFSAEKRRRALFLFGQDSCPS